MSTGEELVRDPLGGHLLDESMRAVTPETPVESQDARAAVASPEQGGEQRSSDLSLLSELANEQMPGDMITELLLRFYGEERAQDRWTISARDVPDSVVGLMKLLQNRCFRAVVDFTGNYFGMRVSTGQLTKHTPETVQVLLARIAALAYLGMHDQALRAYGLFGDLDRAEVAGLLPFSFELFYAVLPAHVGQELVALDRLYALLAQAQAADTRRRARVHYCLAWCYLRLKEYALCVSVLEDMARAGGDGDAVGLRQYIGRVCLALGDGHRAWDHFKQAEEALGAAAETTLAVHLCRGNLSLALGRHEDAYNHFARAVALDPTSMPARNNQAVAAVYLGRLTEGIAILKQALEDGADARALLNLATMYELESSRSGESKKNLLAHVVAHTTDSFPADCLKLL